MKDQYFFGFGSLVNTATHRYRRTEPVVLSGWRRIWRHTNISETAFLSATPDPDAQISGLIAHVPDNNWAELDLRETGYFRSALSAEQLTATSQDIDVHVYQTRMEGDVSKMFQHPILRSYLDCVVQGYLQCFGEQGVADFFDSTSGWEAPVLDDRASPRYPRHQTLTADETALVDAHLTRLSVKTVLP